MLRKLAITMAALAALTALPAADALARMGGGGMGGGMGHGSMGGGMGHGGMGGGTGHVGMGGGGMGHASFAHSPGFAGGTRSFAGPRSILSATPKSGAWNGNSFAIMRSCLVSFSIV